MLVVSRLLVMRPTPWLLNSVDELDIRESKYERDRDCTEFEYLLLTGELDQEGEQTYGWIHEWDRFGQVVLARKGRNSAT